jgi:putative ABC transport system permease protein
MSWDRWAHILPLRLRSLFRRREVERELDEELRDHVERQIEQFVAAGMSPADARTEALRALGGIERRKEECRDARGLNLLEHLARDGRLALRGLGRNPGYTVVALLTLALGIGATAAIFTVVNGVLLRPLEYQDPGRLVVLQYQRGNTVAAANFLDFRQQSRSFEAVGAAEWWSPNLTGGERPEELEGLHLSADVLPMLGVEPLLGRVFRPEEEHAGNHRVVVLSYELWRTRFAGEPGVVGRSLTIDGEPYQVIGVMPRGFRFAPFWATGARLWAPLVLDQRQGDRGGGSLRVFARLRPNVSLAAARTEVAGIAARLERAFPGTNRDGTVVPLMDKVVGDVREALLVLLAAVGFVLLIACANVAHLQLLRAAAREREFALRGALGASRARLVQQSLVESGVLALAGGAAGLLVAWGGVRLLTRLAPQDIPRLDTLGVDRMVLAFVVVVTLGATVLFGLVPALTAARADLHGLLKEGGRG